MKKTWLVGLAATMLLGTTAALAAGGSADNPLISLNYLQKTFLPGLTSQVDGQIQRTLSQGYASADQKLVAQTNDIRKKLSGAEEGEMISSHFLYRTYYRGDQITLSAGSSILLLEGTATAVASGSEIIDLTDGISAQTMNLTPSHRYLAGENGEVTVTILSDAANISQAGIINAKLSDEDVTPFTDLVSTDWYYEYCAEAYDRGLFQGVTDSTFAPKGPVTRGMLTTVLYRQAGQPDYDPGDEKLEDVTAGAWYERSVAWAASVGIVDGMGDGTFQPNQNVTREQVAVMVYRYAKSSLGWDVSEKGSLSQFSDRKKVSDWATEGLSWAVGAGILNGKDGGTLDPQGTATRGEIAAIMQRLANL